MVTGEDTDEMRRAISSIVFATMATLAFSQGSFTIVRPFDGAKVREVVRVLMPRNSVPQGSYVGVFLSGEFIEAVEPKLNAKKDYYEYLLDTKLLEDKSYKLELKLFADFGSQARIVDTSSIDITVANRTGINVPDDGIKLRYNFVAGRENIYRMQQRQVVNLINEKDQKLGSRPFQIQDDGESIRLLYATDNSYPNGEGLVRMQVVPDRGIKNREYAFLTTASSGGVPEKFYPKDMAAIYMRLSPTGREVFGAIPDYFGIDGNTGQGARLALYASFPLPVLPTKAVRVGDTWQTTFQDGAINLEKRYTVKSVVENTIARGDFVRTEWEMGHPCAVIKNSLAVGTSASPKTAGAGADKLSGEKQQIEETIWFALDTRQVIKFYRDITTEGKTTFGGAASGGGPSAGGPGAGGPPSRGGAGGKGGGTSPDDFSLRGSDGKLRAQRGRPGGPPSGGTPSGGPPGGRGGFGNPGGQGGAPQVTLTRVRRQSIFVLEK